MGDVCSGDMQSLNKCYNTLDLWVPQSQYSVQQAWWEPQTSFSVWHGS